MTLTATGVTIPDELNNKVNQTVISTKDFIKTSKDMFAKSNLHNDRVKVEQAAEQTSLRERTMIFSLGCITRTLEELETVFAYNINGASFNDLQQWQKELPTYDKKFQKLTDDYKECIQSSITTAESMETIRVISERYFHLDEMKKKFSNQLQNAISTRELDKHLDFNKNQLNIKLPRFSGYDSEMDYYTFRSTFEKLHLESTPKNLLPDLLRNNYLKEPAATLVKTLKTIEEIWQRLSQAYGDTKIMLQKKMNHIKSLDLNRKDPEKSISGLGELINLMHDVATLARTHQIEEYLYYGDGLARIIQLIGDSRTTRFISKTCEEDLTQKKKWDSLVTFLNKERRILEEKLLLNNGKPDAPKQDTAKRDTLRQEDNRTPGFRRTITSSNMQSSHLSSQQAPSTTCSICNARDGTSDHISTNGPGGMKLIQYFACKTFVESSPADRFNLLKEKGYCYQCLFPGALSSFGKHSEGRCQHDFVCTHPSHQRFAIKKHVLVCHEYRASQENQRLLQKYIQRFIRNPNLPDFVKNINLSAPQSTNTQQESFKMDNHHFNDRGIYLLQRISVNNQNLLIFFDNGCSDFVISQQAIHLLGTRASKQSSQPVTLGGVGNTKTSSTLGTYRIRLPLHNNNDVEFSGICLQSITAPFPTYPLVEVADDIHNHYTATGGRRPLPKLPTSIGGEVHMMIGIKYLRYHPKMVFQLPSGLAIYQSMFINSSGGRGVVGGPHNIFTNIHNQLDVCMSNEYRNIKSQQSDVPLLGYQDSPQSSEVNTTFLSTSMRVFEEVEATGSEIMYRCPQCRSCNACKHGPTNETISIKEEIEQSIIDSSITIDVSTNIVKARLPFTADPTSRLSNNKYKALKIYKQQLDKLNKPCNLKDKDDIITSEAKLQQLGFVDYFKNLPSNLQSMLQNHAKKKKII